MPNTNFLCIDDQQDRTVDDLLKVLRKNSSSLVIDRRVPIELAAQIKQISAASKEQENFGLLLDLRLDQEAGENHPKVPYRGPTLAQELRTRMAEKKIAPFPIVLWSITEKFVKSFDESSHDLFDAVFGKDDQITDNPAQVAVQMISLVDGYAQIVANKKSRLASSMLGFEQEPTGILQASFFEEFKYLAEKKAAHEISSYLINSLITPSGLLISQNTLAARLGVDVEKSGVSWDKLKLNLEAAKYNGPFNAGWQRWWWFTVEVWWESLNPKQPNLRRIGAADRVKILNEKYELSLKPASAIQENYSDKFFCVCVATGSPLDPIDGFRVVEVNVKSWQDISYVSGYAALNRISKNKWRISSLDRERFDRLKKN